MPKGKPTRIESAARFGRLVFLREVEPRTRLGKKRGRVCEISVRRCEVRCDCEKITVVDLDPMYRGCISSCGCLRKESAATKLKMFRAAGGSSRLKHGHAWVGAETPEYHSWRAAQERCLDPNNHQFCRYGARGITFCSRWLGERGFREFLGRYGFATRRHNSWPFW